MKNTPKAKTPFFGSLRCSSREDDKSIVQSISRACRGGKTAFPAILCPCGVSQLIEHSSTI